MQRLSGYLWKLLTYENQITSGDPCQEKVQTHLLSERELIACNFQVTMYVRVLQLLWGGYGWTSKQPPLHNGHFFGWTVYTLTLV